MLKSLSPQQNVQRSEKIKIKKQRIKSSDFPPSRVCVAVESRFHASVLINNGGSDLSAAVQYDLTDQNLNGKERFCQCFSLVGLVSGQKQIFMDVSKAIHLIRKAYLSLTWSAYAQFMWELSKLVICPQLFSAQSSDFTQQVELFAIRALTTEKTLRRQTKTLFTGQTVFLSLSHNLETEVKIWQGYALVEGGG